MIPSINLAVRIISATATGAGKVKAIEKISKIIVSLKKYPAEFVKKNSDKFLHILRYIANQTRQPQYKSLDEILDNAANAFPGAVYLFSGKQEFKSFFRFLWNELSQTGLF